MRFIKLIFLISVFHPVVTHAQDSLAVTENQKTMSKGSRSCFSINIPQAKQKDVVSSWKRYLRQSSRRNVLSENGEFLLDKTVLSPIGTDTIQLYSRISESEKGIGLDVFISGQDSVFFSSAATPARIAPVLRFVRDFGIQQYKSAVEDELDAETKKSNQLQKELDRLYSSNEKSQRKINENSRSIDRQKSDIRSNEKEQDMKEDQILKQKQSLNSFTGTADQRDAEEKKLKALEKEKKKLIRNNESMHKDIDDLESEIRELERNIEKTTNEAIPQKKEEVKKQQSVVKAVSEKYNNIR